MFIVVFYILYAVCPGPPEAPTLVSGVPPNAALSWSPPSASGAWSYMYEVSWTNGSNIVPRQAGTTAKIPGLQAETNYTVVITAYPVNTLCPNQSTMFTFMTTQSELNVLCLKTAHCHLRTSSQVWSLLIVTLSLTCRMPQPFTNVQWPSYSAAWCCPGELDSCWLQ